LRDRTERVTAFRTHGIARRKDAPEGVMNFITRLQSMVRDDAGQDLLEYALLVALIALVCVAAVTAAGTSVQGIFTAIAAAI
jgi:pilus assembly protein Flp/PilA